MKKRFYVIDAEENVTSYSPSKDKSEFFTTEAAAMKKATDLADSEPGKTFFICATTRYAVCNVQQAQVRYVK